MSELTDWGQTTLGKHCVICTGKKDVNEGEMSGIYPFFTCSRNHIYSNKYSFDTEALLIAGNGEVGNVEYYKGKFEAYQRTYVLDNFNINIQYIYHLLKYSLKDTLSRSHAGSVIQFIRLEDLTGFTFFYPKDNQEILRIVKILDTIDTAIQQTQAIINKLKQLKQGLLHDLLTRGVGANGELRPCYEDAPHLYKESPLGWIPKEWEVKELAQLLGNDEPSMRSGPFGSALLKSELVEAGIPLLGIDNVHVEYFDNRFSRFVTAKKFYELARYAVRPNDLMITIMGTVGRCCLVPSDIGTALSSKHTWTITLNPNLYSPYLAMLQINYSPWALDHFSKGEQGGIMSAIRSDTLRTLILPTPPITEQKEIASRLLNISERISLEIVSVKKLQMKKTALMDDLLTGRVRVTSLLQPEASSA